MDPRPASLPPLHRQFLERALPHLVADDRIVGVAGTGSYATDSMDEHSDLDLLVAVEPSAHAQLLAERAQIAARLGPLLAAFTGEHVHEPRLLICLYGPPLLHVDLKFVAIDDVAQRVDQPRLVWQRDARLEQMLALPHAPFPRSDAQWIEDRFWVWVHYGASKILRGEHLEALDFLASLRNHVLGPSGLAQRGHTPLGVRKVEHLAPDLAAALRATVATADPAALCAALSAAVDLYREQRQRELPQPRRNADAEREAMAFLEQVRRTCGKPQRTAR